MPSFEETLQQIEDMRNQREQQMQINRQNAQILQRSNQLRNIQNPYQQNNNIDSSKLKLLSKSEQNKRTGISPIKNNMARNVLNNNINYNQTQEEQGKERFSKIKDIQQSLNERKSPTLAQSSNSLEQYKNILKQSESLQGSSNSSIVNASMAYKGTKYVWGGTSKKGIDCSGLTQASYKANGINIPRVASDQYKASKKIKLSEMQSGDLIFFNTINNKKLVDHVGIYIGNGKMINASSGGGKVQVDNIYDKYWKPKIVGSGRFSK